MLMITTVLVLRTCQRVLHHVMMDIMKLHYQILSIHAVQMPRGLEGISNVLERTAQY